MHAAMNRNQENAFLNEWRTLFGGEKVDDVKIQKYCFNGCLTNSYLRSIVWRIILKILPLRRLDWMTRLQQSRKIFDELRIRMSSDPRRISTNLLLDPININPLSQQPNNPWCQYFEDRKLREIINNDVSRTYPDISFFQSQSIQDLMIEVLFIYSKSYPKISYRQGMHELLAVIIYMLYSDREVFVHLKEENYLSLQGGFSFDDIHLLEVINDKNFTAHDAYIIFCNLMELVETFYCVNKNGNQQNKEIRVRTFSIANTTFHEHLTRIPFSDECEQDLSELHRKLDFIHDELLMAIDPALARHLSSLQILPQVYGIRWLRLLFGREFSFQQLFIIWDLIFADKSSYSMVDYVFVALLVNIRHYLLHGDYVTCMNHFMAYPPIQDANIFVQFVLHLKYPQRYSIPDSMNNLFQYIRPERLNARTEWIWIKNNITSPINDNKFSIYRKQLQRTRPLDNVLNKIGRQALAAAYSSNFPRKIDKTIVDISEGTVNNDKRVQTISNNELERKRSSTPMNTNNKISPQHLESNGEIELMKEQISLLQSRLNDVDFIGQISARQIRACAEEKRMETIEGRRKVVEELQEIADQLTRSTVSEQLIMRHMQPPPAVPDDTKGEAVELASEVLGIRLQPQTSSLTSNTTTRSYVPLKSLQNSNEMIELRFDRKKNF